MKDDVVFMIFKQEYSSDTSKPYETYFGWTKHKSILKAFLEIRSKRLYRFQKQDLDDFAEDECKKMFHKDFMLDTIEMQTKNDEIILFITTPEEMVKAENKILNLFKNTASLPDGDDITYAIRAFQVLKKKYSDALEYLGYFPKELNLLDQDYDESEEGLRYMADNYQARIGTIFSAESFIRVLKEDIL